MQSLNWQRVVCEVSQEMESRSRERLLAFKAQARKSTVLHFLNLGKFCVSFKGNELQPYLTCSPLSCQAWCKEEHA